MQHPSFSEGPREALCATFSLRRGSQRGTFAFYVSEGLREALLLPLTVLRSS